MPSASWANGWIAGDVVTAAEYKKSVGAIYDTTLTGTAANIDITGIVATYAHLELWVYARGTTAAATTQILLRFNNDATAQYQWQVLYGSGAVPASAEALATTSILVGNMPAASAGANMFGSCEIDVPYYLTGNMKALDSLYGLRTGTATGTGFSGRASGWWNGAAINRITLLPSAGNFEIGTRVTLYARGA